MSAVRINPDSHKTRQQEDTILYRTLLLTLTIYTAASLTISQLAYAQISEFKITASDGAAFDNFGRSVSISGDYSVMGSHRDDDNGDGSGSAYVFRRTGTTWAQEAKLLPPMGQKVISSEFQSPCQATTPLWVQKPMMMMEVVQVRLMYIPVLLLALTTRERDYLRNLPYRKTTPTRSTR